MTKTYSITGTVESAQSYLVVDEAALDDEQKARLEAARGANDGMMAMGSQSPTDGLPKKVRHSANLSLNGPEPGTYGHLTVSHDEPFEVGDRYSITVTVYR